MCNKPDTLTSLRVPLDARIVSLTVPPLIVPPASVNGPIVESSVWLPRFSVPTRLRTPGLVASRLTVPSVAGVMVPYRFTVLLLRLIVPLLVQEPVRLTGPPRIASMVPSLTQLVPLIVMLPPPGPTVASPLKVPWLTSVLAPTSRLALLLLIVMPAAMVSVWFVPDKPMPLPYWRLTVPLPASVCVLTKVRPV